MPGFPPPTRVQGPVAVFADAHLGQVERDADDFLTALERVRNKGVKTVVLLGDIFHYFFGDARLQSAVHRRVIETWRGLRAAGVSLRYVEGNRDFFLEGTAFADAFSAYGVTDGLTVGGKSYAFVHGDRVNTADLPYRFWRVVSKNPMSRELLKVIPGPLARAIVHRTEARLYRSNFRHKSVLPEAALLAEARRARAAGYDEVLVGHFHVARVLSSSGGVAQVLPAWLEERKHVEIAPDGTLTIVEEESAARAVKRGFGPVMTAASP